MTNNWINTRLGQSIIAIGVIFLLFVVLKSPVYFVVASVFVFLLPVGFRDPYVFGLIFFAFSVFRLHEVIPELYELHIAFISAILSILSLIVNIHLGRIKIYWRKEMTYFLAFFLVVTIGVPLAYTFSIAYEYWSETFVKIVIIFFMITWTMTKENAYKLMVSVSILCGVFLSLLTLYNVINKIALVERTRASVGSFINSSIGDPNDLSLTLLFSFSFAFSMLFSSSRSLFIRLSGFLCSSIIMAAILATQSRGGLLGLAGVIGYFVALRVKSKSTVLVFIGLVVVALFSSYSRFGSDAVQVLDESAMGRVHAWEAAINMGIHHPIFGVGLHEYQDNYYNYAIVVENKQFVSHSSWLEVFAEIGFPGLALFIYCYYLAIKTASQNIQRIENPSIQLPEYKPIYHIVDRGLFAGLISYFFTSTFLSQAFTWPFYMFSALTIAFAHTIDNKGAS